MARSELKADLANAPLVEKITAWVDVVEEIMTESCPDRIMKGKKADEAMKPNNQLWPSFLGHEK